MLERLQDVLNRRADRLLIRVIARLARKTPPEGVEIKALPNGVQLSGKALKRRMIDDAELRNFGK
jgi:hypothetical protein